ncbi:hypothetical protein BGW80DRAFT_1443345 [Lactifluus volemus]|nr:hypothetical protein BGW80DRAFT_1443345 [Lactifluus volemus]
MSGYKNFAIVGTGMTGSFIVRQLLKYKATGTVNEVVVLTREWQGFKATVDDDAKTIPVDHSNKQSIKDALATSSVDVVIYTVSSSCLGLQTRIAEAAKDAGVKLFVPSEFGGSAEGSPTFSDAKGSIQSQLTALHQQDHNFLADFSSLSGLLTRPDKLNKLTS